MKYAVYLPNFGPYGDARVLASLAKDTEAAGWDGFFIWDHIVPWGGWPTPTVDTTVALTAIALNTSRIRFGGLVTPLPRRRPWKFARETATLDHLSNGRLVVGVGIGDGPNEWSKLGEEADKRKRGAMLEEGLEVLKALWSGEPVTHHSEYYPIEDTQFLPKPVQSPHIPVWVGGFWPHKAPLRRAAHWDGVFGLVDKMDDSEKADVHEMITFVLQERGHCTEPFDIVYAGHPTPGDNPERAAEIVQTYADMGVTWWLEHINPFPFGGDMQGVWPLDKMRERILQGPPKI